MSLRPKSISSQSIEQPMLRLQTVRLLPPYRVPSARLAEMEAAAAARVLEEESLSRSLGRTFSAEEGHVREDLDVLEERAAVDSCAPLPNLVDTTLPIKRAQGPGHAGGARSR